MDFGTKLKEARLGLRQVDTQIELMSQDKLCLIGRIIGTFQV
ncbi:hypothetical protein [Erysipelothrix aquatica]|nr:hypothetical protein [Erysipelothrix aquatica]